MLVAVLSLKGSPGVTTFGLALAARWPAPVHSLLVEADPAGGDVAVRFSLPSAPGLVGLAAAARRGNDPALLWRHAQALPGGLAVVAAPADAEQARAALSTLTLDPSIGAGVLTQASEAPETVVIADCGRIDPATPAMPIVRAADAMVLLTRAHADDLAHLARRLPAVGRWSTRPVLLLVGEGYSTTDVARELGVAPLAAVPEDPRGAAVLTGRPCGAWWRRGSPSRSGLGRAARQVAAALASPPTATIPAAPGPHAPENQSVPVPRAVPGVPSGPVSTNGLRHAPTPHPAVEDGDSRGAIS